MAEVAKPEKAKIRLVNPITVIAALAVATGLALEAIGNSGAMVGENTDDLGFAQSGEHLARLGDFTIASGAFLFAAWALMTAYQAFPRSKQKPQKSEGSAPAPSDAEPVAA